MSKVPGILLLVVLFAACSQEPPEIKEKFAQVNLRDDRDTGTVYEELSLFLHVDDEDGYEDLEYLYLVQEDEELFWELDADEWTYRERDGEIWIGSNDLVTADFTDFPPGTYRVILIDKAGERMETEIYVKKAGRRPSLPAVTVTGGSVSLDNPPGQMDVWVYNGEELVESREFTGGTIPAGTFKGDGNTHFFIYYYDNDAGRGIVRGPFYL